MKKIIPALMSAIDYTIYNVISTPFSTIARAIIEGSKYARYFSSKINGDEAKFLKSILGYGAGLIGFGIGATLGTAKELILAVEYQARIIRYDIKFLLGNNNDGSEISNSYKKVTKLYNEIKDNFNYDGKLTSGIALIFTIVACPVNLMFITPYNFIAKGIKEFCSTRNARKDDLAKDNYLKNGDYKAIAKNMVVAPFAFVGGTIYNIIGSLKSIPTIMFKEAQRYGKWGNISKDDSYLPTKVVGAVTSVAAGGLGLVVGAVEGALDTVAYEAKKVIELTDRLGGNRQFVKEAFTKNKYAKLFDEKLPESNLGRMRRAVKEEKRWDDNFGKPNVIKSKYKDFTTKLNEAKPGETIGIF